LRGEDDFGAHEILTEKMEKAAEMSQFELAIRYRDGLRFLDKLKERTITNVARDLNCDVFGTFTSGEIFAVSVLTVRAGKMIGIQNFANEGVLGGVEEFVAQYYLENPRIGETVTEAERGVKKQLLEMANENAREYTQASIEKIEFKQQFTVGACEELAKELGLKRVPKRIECFDVSNLHGEETVASMVVFIDGRAEKKLYRRFKIRSHDGIDDYKSMQEVLKRRMQRDDWGFPDLIVVDGGKGQLSAVSGMFESIIAFSEKDEIFSPKNGEPIILSKRSYALRLLQRVRDEAHRFAIMYNKKRRDMKSAKQFKKN
jgi:excinuclease ABC subunit C